MQHSNTAGSEFQSTSAEICFPITPQLVTMEELPSVKQTILNRSVPPTCMRYSKLEANFVAEVQEYESEIGKLKEDLGAEERETNIIGGKLSYAIEKTDNIRDDHECKKEEIREELRRRLTEVDESQVKQLESSILETESLWGKMQDQRAKLEGIRNDIFKKENSVRVRRSFIRDLRGEYDEDGSQ